MIIDITHYSFMDKTAEETNDWMNQYVGRLIHDDPETSYGEGWRLVYERETASWCMKIDDEAKAAFFILRWS